MGERESGRQAALQMLYGLELQGRMAERLERHIADYWRELPAEPEGRAFAEELVRGVVARIDAIDAHIRRVSKNWRLERMTRVDRNVLRIGIYELLDEPATPREVIIDQAVELAKRFGAESSGQFVNGLLDRLADDLGR